MSGFCLLMCFHFHQFLVTVDKVHLKCNAIALIASQCNSLSICLSKRKASNCCLCHRSSSSLYLFELLKQNVKNCIDYLSTCSLLENVANYFLRRPDFCIYNRYFCIQHIVRNILVHQFLAAYHFMVAFMHQ